LRSALVVIQTALSVVLLVGAALFVRSLRNLEAVDVGYDANQIAFTSIYSLKGNLDVATMTAELNRIAVAMHAFPGVTNTAIASSTPLRSSSGVATYVPGSDSALHYGEFRGPWATGVSADFFATAGITRLAGRTFDGTETATSEPVVVVSQRFAKLTWPGRSGLGECLLLKSKTAPCARVVGVVADVHTGRIVEDPETRYYVPIAQSPFKLVPSIVVRATPAALGRASVELTKRIASVAPGANVRVWTVAEAFAPELRPWVVGTQLFIALGLIALIVASVGIYSVASYTMSQRANEIGIRMALGARDSDIFKLAARGAVAVLGIGATLGVVLAVALGRFVRSLLFGVTTVDAVSLASAALLLVTLGVVANLVPAWRASQIDPVQTLKAE
jgi:putative ABC transport system permease protein